MTWLRSWDSKVLRFYPKPCFLDGWFVSVQKTGLLRRQNRHCNSNRSCLDDETALILDLARIKRHPHQIEDLG